MGWTNAGMARASPQATVTLPDLQLENVAQVVSYHIPLPIVQRLDLLVLIGQGSHMGLLYDLDPSYSLGAVTGFVALSRDLNIYPGVFGDLGGWMTWRQGGQFSVGLTALPLPGLGLGYNSQRFAPR